VVLPQSPVAGFGLVDPFDRNLAVRSNQGGQRCTVMTNHLMDYLRTDHYAIFVMYCGQSGGGFC